MYELNEDEQSIVALVNDWVDREVRPVVRELEHSDTYPADLLDQMGQMGIFGLAIPEPWNDSAVSTSCAVAVSEGLARGWMTLAGPLGGHYLTAKLIEKFGTQEQKDRYLPGMATGEIRVATALTEPGGGSDLQAMRTTARLDGEDYIVNGTKTWITNSHHAQMFALLCRTDVDAQPRHRGISVLLVEKGPGFEVSRSLPKLGYKGIDSSELSFSEFRTPRSSLLGTAEGEGFAQMMGGMELGRIMISSIAIGVAQAALDEAIRYSQERESFGKQIWQHQSVGNHLAEMATQVMSARQLLMYAARCYDSGGRCDLEAGMAKLFASEMSMDVVFQAMRVHGGYGYSTEFNLERYYRDAPLTVLGEGSNEIQKYVIARQLIQRSRL